MSCNPLEQVEQMLAGAMEILQQKQQVDKQTGGLFMCIFTQTFYLILVKKQAIECLEVVLALRESSP